MIAFVCVFSSLSPPFLQIFISYFIFISFSYSLLLLKKVALTPTVIIPIVAIAAINVTTTAFDTTTPGVGGIAYSPLSGTNESINLIK